MSWVQENLWGPKYFRNTQNIRDNAKYPIVLLVALITTGHILGPRRKAFSDFDLL